MSKIEGFPAPTIRSEARYARIANNFAVIDDTENRLLQLKSADLEAWQSQGFVFLADTFTKKHPVAIRRAAQMIEYAPEELKSELTKLAFCTQDLETINFAAKNIATLPTVQRGELGAWLTEYIDLKLSSNETEIMTKAIRMVTYASEEERSRLIQRALDTKDTMTMLTATRLIEKVPQEQRRELIEKALSTDDSITMRVAISQIGKVPKEQRMYLINLAMKSTDPETVYEAAVLIWKASRHNSTEVENILIMDYIKHSFISKDIDAIVAASKMIYFAPQLEWENLTKILSDFTESFISSNDPEEMLTATNLIDFVPPEQSLRLRRVISDYINKTFSTNDSENMLLAAQMITFAPEDERSSLITLAINSSDLDTRSVAIYAISYVPLKQRVDLI